MFSKRKKSFPMRKNIFWPKRENPCGNVKKYPGNDKNTGNGKNTRSKRKNSRKQEKYPFEAGKIRSPYSYLLRISRPASLVSTHVGFLCVLWHWPCALRARLRKIIRPVFLSGDAFVYFCLQTYLQKINDVCCFWPSYSNHLFNNFCFCCILSSRSLHRDFPHEKPKVSTIQNRQKFHTDMLVTSHSYGTMAAGDVSFENSTSRINIPMASSCSLEPLLATGMPWRFWHFTARA